MENELLTQISLERQFAYDVQDQIVHRVQLWCSGGLRIRGVKEEKAVRSLLTPSA